eukprot:g15333.t1
MPVFSNEQRNGLQQQLRDLFFRAAATPPDTDDGIAEQFVSIVEAATRAAPKAEVSRGATTNPGFSRDPFQVRAQLEPVLAEILHDEGLEPEVIIRVLGEGCVALGERVSSKPDAAMIAEQEGEPSLALLESENWTKEFHLFLHCATMVFEQFLELVRTRGNFSEYHAAFIRVLVDLDSITKRVDVAVLRVDERLVVEKRTLELEKREQAKLKAEQKAGEGSASGGAPKVGDSKDKDKGAKGENAGVEKKGASTGEKGSGDKDKQGEPSNKDKQGSSPSAAGEDKENSKDTKSAEKEELQTVKRMKSDLLTKIQSLDELEASSEKNEKGQLQQQQLSMAEKIKRYFPAVEEQFKEAPWFLLANQPYTWSQFNGNAPLEYRTMAGTSLSPNLQQSFTLHYKAYLGLANLLKVYVERLQWYHGTGTCSDENLERGSPGVEGRMRSGSSGGAGGGESNAGAMAADALQVLEKALELENKMIRNIGRVTRSTTVKSEESVASLLYLEGEAAKAKRAKLKEAEAAAAKKKEEAAKKAKEEAAKKEAADKKKAGDKGDKEGTGEAERKKEAEAESSKEAPTSKTDDHDGSTSPVGERQTTSAKRSKTQLGFSSFLELLPPAKRARLEKADGQPNAKAAKWLAFLQRKASLSTTATGGSQLLKRAAVPGSSGGEGEQAGDELEDETDAKERTRGAPGELKRTDPVANGKALFEELQPRSFAELQNLVMSQKADISANLKASPQHSSNSSPNGEVGKPLKDLNLQYNTSSKVTTTNNTGKTSSSSPSDKNKDGKEVIGNLHRSKLSDAATHAALLDVLQNLSAEKMTLELENAAKMTGAIPAYWTGLCDKIRRIFTATGAAQKPDRHNSNHKSSIYNDRESFLKPYVPLHVRLPSDVGFGCDPERFQVQLHSAEFQFWFGIQILIFLQALEHDSRKPPPGQAASANTSFRSVHRLPFGANAANKAEKQTKISDEFAVLLHSKEFYNEYFWACWKRTGRSDPVLHQICDNKLFPEAGTGSFSGTGSLFSPSRARSSSGGGSVALGNNKRLSKQKHDRKKAEAALLNALKRNPNAESAAAAPKPRTSTGGGGGVGAHQSASRAKSRAEKCNEFIDRLVADETGESGVEEEYKVKRDNVFMWQLRRLFGESYLDEILDNAHSEKVAEASGFLNLVFKTRGLDGAALAAMEEERKRQAAEEDLEEARKLAELFGETEGDGEKAPKDLIASPADSGKDDE